MSTTSPRVFHVKRKKGHRIAPPDPTKCFAEGCIAPAEPGLTIRFADGTAPPLCVDHYRETMAKIKAFNEKARVYVPRYASHDQIT